MRYDPKRYERLLKRRIAAQAKRVEEMIDSTIASATRSASRVTLADGADFYFRNYPALSREVDLLLKILTLNISGLINSATQWSWDLANTKNDDMLSRILSTIGVNRIPQGAIERWGQANLPALSAFQDRKIGGMGLSDRVWKYTGKIKGDMELALDLGLGEGKNAAALSRDVRRFLKEPDRLYRRVRDEKGVLRLSKSAANYHPGQGVYRSSYKNAIRLTATETNMAYRSADYERVQSLDFVLGIEVHLSNNHTCLDSKGVPQPFHDICDELEGRYPKDFKFVGWHPNCRCYTTTILPSEDEMLQYLSQMDENGNSDYEFKGRVTDIPPQMKEWLEDNEDRVLRSKSVPYFLAENPQIATSDEMADKIIQSNQERQDREQERAELNSISESAVSAGQMTAGQIKRLNELSSETITQDVFEDSNGRYVESRQQIHESIISNYIGEGSVRSDTVYMLGGAPANGKSTVVDSGLISYPEGILTLDVDKIKRMIPEYGISEASSSLSVRNNAANFVHEESSYLGKTIQSRVFASGQSLVIDGVNDGSYEKVASKVEKIRSATGMRVRADYVTCDTAESIRRNQERYERTGRLVKESVVEHDNKAISKIVPDLIKNATFDELFLWDTNSKEGARLVLSMVDGTLTMYDESLYERFLAKAR